MPTSPLITRSQTLPEPTDITQELWRTADSLLSNRLPVGHLPVRLVGMGVSGLDDTGLVQGMLFDGEEREKQSQLDAVADEIKGGLAKLPFVGVAVSKTMRVRGRVDCGRHHKSQARDPNAKKGTPPNRKDAVGFG